MNLRLTIVTLLVIATTVARGQGEYNTWYFGQNVSLTFSAGAVTVGQGPLHTEEGTSLWCGADGRPLFSTDGRTLYSADGLPMLNGRGLEGGWSSTQSALVVPDPGNSQRFYVFTVGDLSNILPPNPGLHYSIVDMTADNGRGDVVVKNRRLIDNCAEKLTATIHCDGRSWWIVAHAHSDPVFYVYRVTEDGISSRRDVTVGSQYALLDSRNPGGPYGLGYIKFSPSGAKLVMASAHAHRLELFDFDTYSGDITNARLLDNRPSHKGSPTWYGAAFSPSEKFLYATTFTRLYRFQLDDPDPLQTLRDLGRTVPIVDTLDTLQFTGGVQCGPDGRLYVSALQYLGIVDQPDDEQAYLVPRALRLDSLTRTLIGMPNIMDCVYGLRDLDVCAPPVADIQFDSVACVGSCLTFQDISRFAPRTWSWSFPGGTPATFEGQSPPPVCYPNTGTYRVELITTNLYGADTAIRTLRIASPPTVNAGPDVYKCDTTRTFLAASGASRYEWSNHAGISNIYVANPWIRVFETTTLTVRGFSPEGCWSEDTVVIHVTPNEPAIQLTGSFSLVRKGSRALMHVRALNVPQRMIHSDSIDLVTYIDEMVIRDVVVTRGRELKRERIAPFRFELHVRALAGPENDRILEFTGTALADEYTPKIIPVFPTNVPQCVTILPSQCEVAVEGCALNLRRFTLVDRQNLKTSFVAIDGREYSEDDELAPGVYVAVVRLRGTVVETAPVVITGLD